MIQWRLKQRVIETRLAEATLTLFCLILLALVTTSTRLYSQDGPSLQFAVTPPKASHSPGLPRLLVQELPYCELGYGPCGGQCSSNEGKKQWNCPADFMPCHHEGQRCTCEASDMCKPKKKKLEPIQ